MFSLHNTVCLSMREWSLTSVVKEKTLAGSTLNCREGIADGKVQKFTGSKPWAKKIVHCNKHNSSDESTNYSVSL